MNYEDDDQPTFQIGIISSSSTKNDLADYIKIYITCYNYDPFDQWLPFPIDWDTYYIKKLIL